MYSGHLGIRTLSAVSFDGSSLVLGQGRGRAGQGRAGNNRIEVVALIAAIRRLG